MAGDPDIGTGATLTFSGITVNLLSIGLSGIARESINTSHLGTVGGRTFLPSDTYDPGSIECEYQLDAGTPTTTMDIETVMVAAAGAFTIQLPTAPSATSGAKWTGNAFATDFNFNLPNEELDTGSFTLKLTGDIATANSA